MANQVGIVTDSISCLDKQMVSQYGIRIVPATFSSGGRVYRDWIDVTPTEAYELFLADPDSFSTSAATPMEYIDAYRELGKQGKDILSITISSKLSTMYNVAQIAREQVSSEYPSVSIEVFDSLTTTAAEGFIALVAATAAADNKSLTEVVKAAEVMRDKVGS